VLVSLKWLEELLGHKLDAEEIRKVSLTLGLEVEDQNSHAPTGIVVGRIKKMDPHPKRKHLSILQVMARKSLQIVTAARHLKEKDLVLVGPVGATLGSQKVTARDFQGVTSQGVLVSEQELGLAEESTGVIVLEKGRPGALFTNAFDDIVLDMSTTPNRPDWLSVEGIARELSIRLNSASAKRGRVAVPLIKQRSSRCGTFKISIKDTAGCPRYTARLFDNIEVRESPFWIKWRLHCMGMKPVNNIVDITNLLMLHKGQPLHPFDLDLLKGNVIVRKARARERFVSLEGTTIALNKDDLVIADGKGTIALAGIIGGRRTQISAATKRVLLESAYFDSKRIAHTSRRLGLMTEASMRFERKADIAVVDETSALAGEMFGTYARAKERAFVTAGTKAKSKTINLSPARMNETLALKLSKKQIKQVLNALNIQISGDKTLRARIPHYRRDLLIEEDLYEEVARVFGYMNIPETVTDKWGGRVSIDRNRKYEEAVRNYLVGQGFSETYNLSLISDKRLIEAGYTKFARVKNPLNERFNALRPTLFLGLLDTVNYNLSKGNKSLKFIEIGNVLFTGAPHQEKRLGAILGGEQYPEFWAQKKKRIDFFDAKGVIESIFRLLHIQEAKFSPTAQKGFKQAVSVSCSGKQLGYIGAIDEDLCKEPYYYFELSVEKMISLVGETFYLPPAKFPASMRDLSFLVREEVNVPDVVGLITRIGGPVLEKVILFDYYKGKNLPPDRKNIGFRFYFRAPDRTLTDSEVDGFIKKIEHEITNQFDAKLRTKE
jgi:phenylalanyl-tRNA synthetase beta chain